MCKAETKKGCEHPEKLNGKLEECSPEQIRECHGEVVEIPVSRESSQVDLKGGIPCQREQSDG